MPTKQPPKKKLIIDTDPGIDDAMAILAAFNCEDLHVVGMTTIYGNVPTVKATQNACVLRELANVPQVDVVQGSLVSMKGLEKTRIASFVHGDDGFGNTNRGPPTTEALANITAAQYIVNTVNANPGEVTILMLAALTNLAFALQLDASIASKWAGVVVLGGVFFENGNVNPASEANIFGDSWAADYVFEHAGDIRVVGLDVTRKCSLTGQDLLELKSQGRFGTFIHEIAQFYLDFHRDSLGEDKIHLHDPTALTAVIHPELFEWVNGAIVVVTEGAAMGHTIVDARRKGKWHDTSAWTQRPKQFVATAVNHDAVVGLIKRLLST